MINLEFVCNILLPMFRDDRDVLIKFAIKQTLNWSDPSLVHPMILRVEDDFGVNLIFAPGKLKNMSRHGGNQNCTS